MSYIKIIPNDGIHCYYFLLLIPNCIPNLDNHFIDKHLHVDKKMSTFQPCGLGGITQESALSGEKSRINDIPQI